MSNIGEAYSTRLARERQEAIKKFIPLRDSLRRKLQERQESQVDYVEGTERLFKPITATTEKVVWGDITDPE